MKWTLLPRTLVFAVLPVTAICMNRTDIAGEYEGVDFPFSMGFTEEGEYWTLYLPHAEGSQSGVGTYQLISDNHVKLFGDSASTAWGDVVTAKDRGESLLVSMKGREVLHLRRVKQDSDAEAPLKGLCGIWGKSTGGEALQIQFLEDGRIQVANEGEGTYKLVGKDKLLLSVGEQKVLCLFRREGDKLVFSVAKERGMNTYELEREETPRQDVLGVLDPLNIEKNESSAASAMRTLCAAEETFRSAICRDVDSDGLGEYGTLEEMGALAPPRGKHDVVDPPFIDALLAKGEKKGYQFAVFVGKGGLACGTDPILRETDACEVCYYATAWPKEYSRTGRLSFCMDASGVLRAKDNAGKPVTSCEAMMGDAFWPVFSGGSRTMARREEPVRILPRNLLEKNERGAVASMRIICSAEETFRSAICRDADNDGLGEYGTLEEMAALSPPKGKHDRLDPPFVDELLGKGEKNGYRFALFVGKEGMACDTEGIDKPVDADEVTYYATAWPLEYGRTGKRSFCMDNSGVIRAKDTGGNPVDSCSAMGRSGDGVWPVYSE